MPEGVMFSDNSFVITGLFSVCENKIHEKCEFWYSVTQKGIKRGNNAPTMRP